MEQRISLITLGVADLARAAAFYEALGWHRAESPAGIVVFDLPGQSLGLYPIADLARDMGIEHSQPGGFSGITLAHNVREMQDVAPLVTRAVDAGARLIRAPHRTAWGGHVAFFADPDGHVWEIAHNPFSPLGPDGAFQWNGAKATE